MFGDEKAGARRAIHRGDGLLLPVGRPIDLARFVRHDRVRQAEAAAHLREEITVVVSALRNDHEIRTARKRQSDQKPDDLVPVGSAGGQGTNQREQAPGHEWKPGQIANVAGERAQAPNARLGFIDAALEDGDAVPIRRQHGGGGTPQLLAATPGPVAADEDDLHCAILVSFAMI